MALATQCPHCGTMFRVASDQLKLRGGIVRCGACQEIFDGSATLVDLDKLPAPAPVPEPAPAPAPAAVEPVPALAGDTAPADDEPAFTMVDTDDGVDHGVDDGVDNALPATPDFDDQPVYTLDFDHTFDPLGILPKAASPDDDEAPPALAVADDVDLDPLSLLQPWSRPQEEALAIEADSSTRLSPAFDLPVDEELVAAPLPDHGPDLDFEADVESQALTNRAPQTIPRLDDAPPLLTRESAASPVTPGAAPMPPPARTPAAKLAEKAAARRSKLSAANIAAQPKLRAPEIDEPEFVKRSRHQEQFGRTRRIAMLAGSILLLFVLLTQGALTFRNALAARFPAMKSMLVSSCALLGCRVELPAQVDKLAIETGELTTLGANRYAFTTELRNGAGTAQAWPAIELTLIDGNGKPLVRRVFQPVDYLTPGTPAANGIASGAAQPIMLNFRVDDLKPSGYHIAVFYP